LAAAAVEKAKSGHPGGAMGGADFINVLYSEFLEYDPKNPKWEGRDRFFLDPGHMSPMLYSVLALCRKIQHGRAGAIPSVGQPITRTPRSGCACAVLKTHRVHWVKVMCMLLVLLLLLNFLKARFGEVMSQTIYAFISDGGVQEEISQGAGRIAGHLGLNNLIMFYDSNDIQLSTETKDVTSEDVAKKYEAWGWKVVDHRTETMPMPSVCIERSQSIKRKTNADYW
jgi:transketolase